MIAFTIPNLRNFTTHLFLKETFDGFLLTEADVVTFNSFHIDGLINKEFFTEEELLQLGEERLSRWRAVRPICFSLIRGHKLPLSFKILFRLSSTDTNKLLAQSGLAGLYDIESFYLNALYKNNALTCVTGTATREFTMDKTAEQIWDTAVKHFFQKWEIDFDMA